MCCGAHNTQNSTQTTQNNMPPSKLIVWICGDCSARNDGSEPGPCVLCDVPRPKRKAVAVDSSAPAASAAVASSAPAKFAAKCGPVDATHPSGLVLDILGIAAGDRGRRCEDHMVCCGELLEEDFVVHLRMERILVPDFLARKGKKREELAITVNWVTDGVDRCRVGFLPWAYALEGAIYDRVLCQVTAVFTKSNPSCAIRKKWYKNKGFARATVISALNKRVLPTGSVDTAAVTGMKGDCLE
jgi:hypothetical protein